MKDMTKELLFAHADDTRIVRFTGTVDNKKVTAMEYGAIASLNESIWAPAASQIQDTIIERNK